VIIGKLMAWTERRSRKHETDIYYMLVFHYLGFDPSRSVDEAELTGAARFMGDETLEFWEAVREAVREANLQRRNKD
jgi:hypothetical protein